MGTTDNNFENKISSSYSTDNYVNYNDSRWIEMGLSRKEITTIYNICCKFLNRRDELEDLLQTAAIELWLTFNKYKERNIEITNKTSFVRRVVMSILIQQYIRKTRRDLIYHTEEPNETNDISNEKNFEGHVCGNKHQGNLDINLIQNVMDDVLDEEDADIAYWYFVQQFTQAEIATAIDRSQSVVSTKLGIIKEALQKKLKEHTR
jgi:RNA polymerase sigma factor (sigma-70 family)